MQRVAATVLAALLLVACTPKGSLERTQVEMTRVEGRRYEVRVASTDVEGEYRVMIVRATMVIDPDLQRERSRNWNVAQPFMERTCKGPFQVLDENLVKVNLYIRFRCT
jgi:hypothetical protein